VHSISIPLLYGVGAQLSSTSKESTIHYGSTEVPAPCSVLLLSYATDFNSMPGFSSSKVDRPGATRTTVVAERSSCRFSI